MGRAELHIASAQALNVQANIHLMFKQIANCVIIYRLFGTYGPKINAVAMPKYALPNSIYEQSFDNMQLEDSTLDICSSAFTAKLNILTWSLHGRCVSSLSLITSGDKGSITSPAVCPIVHLVQLQSLFSNSGPVCISSIQLCHVFFFPRGEDKSSIFLMTSILMYTVLKLFYYLHLVFFPSAKKAYFFHYCIMYIPKPLLLSSESFTRLTVLHNKYIHIVNQSESNAKFYRKSTLGSVASQ